MSLRLCLFIGLLLYDQSESGRSLQMADGSSQCQKFGIGLLEFSFRPRRPQIASSTTSSHQRQLQLLKQGCTSVLDAASGDFRVIKTDSEDSFGSRSFFLRHHNLFVSQFSTILLVFFISLRRLYLSATTTITLPLPCLKGELAFSSLKVPSLCLLVLPHRTALWKSLKTFRLLVQT
jgi:hypothetical protein